MDQASNLPAAGVNAERRPVYFLAETVFVPPTDVWETEDSLFILLEIAHLDLKKCSIKYADGFVVVKGKRLLPGKPDDKSIVKYHKKEIECGDFCVKVKMNTRIDHRQIMATFKEGFLHLKLGKKFTSDNETGIEIPVEI